MTSEWYRSNGFEVSANLSESRIEKAEKAVWNAYILPVIPSADLQDETLQKQLATLAYYYLCLENAKITRKGTKSKTDEHSVTISPGADQLALERTMANTAFNQIMKRADATGTGTVDDILRIWLSSTLLGDDFLPFSD